MNLVLDGSMVLAWLFERTVVAEAQQADLALLAVADARTLVPPLWHSEVANALLLAEPRGVVTEAQVCEFLSKLYDLPLATDAHPPIMHRDALLALARNHGLRAYDATYLELALRTNSALATFDRKLAAAIVGTGGAIF